MDLERDLVVILLYRGRPVCGIAGIEAVLSVRACSLFPRQYFGVPVAQGVHFDHEPSPRIIFEALTHPGVSSSRHE